MPDLLYYIICSLLLTGFSLLLVVLIVARRIRDKVGKLFSEDISHLTQKEATYRQRFPNEDEAQILQRVIRSEARIAGTVGFFAGLGGIVTLPITLPINILATIRIQYRLAEFLISKQANRPLRTDTQRAKALAVVFGSRRLSEAGSKVAIRTAGKYAPQAALKCIPLIGAITGFLIDYYGTRAVGKVTSSQSRASSPKQLT
ncbi:MULTISPECIES: hypothetical protein [unclassified Lentimonas]|uniref:hypothetical protein n=1 Tax=unclassified Lentimonas TaxID=2630993 RepID=UPI001321DB8D|nr:MULTISPECIES: hypothetical protein [unclassified Lentimonas]CAA6690562.1 Unannotated [Lentimonas sp. CC10]CAA6695348.1 Unannotated [Lentimonas sp. CC19]CAA7068819.1 Unannotated [Lentimonas sp. CC11]